MATIKKLFPLSFKTANIKELLITLLIYIVADFVCGLVIGLLGHLPLIGILFGLIGWIAGIYFFVGIIIAILNFLGVFKA